MKRSTLGQSIHLSGIGIHSGAACNITIYPAEFGAGITFITMAHGKEIKVPALASYTKNQARATLLEHDGAMIMTPEHLLAALFGLGISDATLSISAPEIPILDGSATPFVDAIMSVGRHISDLDWAPITIEKPLSFSEGSATVIAVPDPELRFSMIIEYDNFIGTQAITWTYNTNTFSSEIAPARTYGFQAEIEALIAAGLAKGGRIDNAVVIGDTAYLTDLRFPDELVRHKLLDLIGDISLAGSFLKGHFIGIRSGHSLNRSLAIALQKNYRDNDTSIPR